MEVLRVELFEHFSEQFDGFIVVFGLDLLSPCVDQSPDLLLSALLGDQNVPVLNALRFDTNLLRLERCISLRLFDISETPLSIVIAVIKSKLGESTKA